MKTFKIMLSLSLVAAIPGTAYAGADFSQSPNRCRMDIPTPWLAYQFIPCWAARIFM